MADIFKKNIEEMWVTDKEEWKNIEEYLLFLKQKKAYDFVSGFCKDNYVLDYGCGSGYGTALLSQCAQMTVGLDISEEVIDYCRIKYKIPNLEFKKIEPNCVLPYKDNIFNVIVSSHVIEHVSDPQQYLLNLKKTLKKDGILFISTPNRKYRLLPFQKPWNPDHLREYGFKQIEKELGNVFEIVEIKGVSGTPEIHRIEYNRVRQNPFRIYFYSPLAKFIKLILPASFVPVIKKMLKREKSVKKNIPTGSNESMITGEESGYSINDFRITGDINNCLDFLAICKNT